MIYIFSVELSPVLVFLSLYVVFHHESQKESHTIMIQKSDGLSFCKVVSWLK